MVVASDTLLSSEAMASDHLIRLERSMATIKVSDVNLIIGVSDVQLLVPMKISDGPSSGGCSASTSLLRSSATRTTEIVLQGLVYNFYFFQSHLYNMWDVNYV